MPRKSAASLSIAKPAHLVKLEDHRPAPPAALSSEEQRVWRLTTSAMPSAWLKGCDEPMLSAYCRHVVMSEVLSSELRKFQTSWLWEDGGARKLDSLLAMRDREMRAATSIATRLRLTPAARTTAKAAHSMIESEPRDGPPPWEEQ